MTLEEMARQVERERNELVLMMQALVRGAGGSIVIDEADVVETAKHQGTYIDIDVENGKGVTLTLKEVEDDEDPS